MIFSTRPNAQKKCIDMTFIGSDQNPSSITLAKGSIFLLNSIHLW